MNARMIGMYSALSLILSAALSWSMPPPLRAEQVVVIVLDDSGSMDETMRTERGRIRKIDAAKEALRDVVVKLPEDTQVGVLALNTEIDGSPWIAPIGPVSRTALLRQLDRIDASGGTPLGQAMKEAADALLQLREKQVYGLYRLLIVTDGEANDQHLVDGYLPDILGRGIVVDVIGVDMRADHSLATQVHSYRRADDRQSLSQAISEVLAETPDDDAAAESDFELLQGFPDEVAAAALAALTAPRNSPINMVEMEYVATEPDGRQVVRTVSPRSRSSSGFVSILTGGALCCVAGFSILGVALLVILAGRRRHR
ncbi:MAG: hypothetical protein KatS3mg111_0580 [Pirellulaceae bacterium]|nr:MAG: hypothetical protein KatS3mg111_0580 [Pirellulaceae bacterium]